MEKYTAVITEPRIHRAWKLVLNNFLTNLDERWDFLIVCGLLNKEFLIELIETNFKEHKHRITIHQLNIENFSYKEYSNFNSYPIKDGKIIFYEQCPWYKKYIKIYN